MLEEEKNIQYLLTEGTALLPSMMSTESCSPFMLKDHSSFITRDGRCRAVTGTEDEDEDQEEGEGEGGTEDVMPSSLSDPGAVGHTEENKKHQEMMNRNH